MTYSCWIIESKICFSLYCFWIVSGFGIWEVDEVGVELSVGVVVLEPLVGDVGLVGDDPSMGEVGLVGLEVLGEVGEVGEVGSVVDGLVPS